MDIYMIRHTSVDVPKGTCYGHTDVSVAASFEQEAEAVRERIDGLSFDKVFTSPLSRCRQLAAFCGFPDAQVDKRLREINFGAWEMRTFDDLFDHEPDFAQWCEDGRYIYQNPPGGESMADVLARFDDFLREQICGKPFQCVALFCHGGLLSLAEGRRKGGAAIDADLTMFPYGHVLRLSEQELRPREGTHFVTPSRE